MNVNDIWIELLRDASNFSRRIQLCRETRKTEVHIGDEFHFFEIFFHQLKKVFGVNGSTTNDEQFLILHFTLRSKIGNWR